MSHYLVRGMLRDWIRKGLEVLPHSDDLFDQTKITYGDLAATAGAHIIAEILYKEGIHHTETQKRRAKEIVGGRLGFYMGLLDGVQAGVRHKTIEAAGRHFIVQMWGQTLKVNDESYQISDVVPGIWMMHELPKTDIVRDGIRARVAEMLGKRHPTTRSLDFKDGYAASAIYTIRGFRGKPVHRSASASMFDHRMSNIETIAHRIVNEARLYDEMAPKVDAQGEALLTNIDLTASRYDMTITEITMAVSLGKNRNNDYVVNFNVAFCGLDSLMLPARWQQDGWHEHESAMTSLKRQFRRQEELQARKALLDTHPGSYCVDPVAERAAEITGADLGKMLEGGELQSPIPGTREYVRFVRKEGVVRAEMRLDGAMRWERERIIQAPSLPQTVRVALMEMKGTPLNRIIGHSMIPDEVLIRGCSRSMRKGWSFTVDMPIRHVVSVR